MVVEDDAKGLGAPWSRAARVSSSPTTAGAGRASGLIVIPAERIALPIRWSDEWRRLHPSSGAHCDELLRGGAARSRPGARHGVGHGPALSQRSTSAASSRAFQEGVRSGRGGWIVTPNLDILRQFTADAESRELILAASHRVADGAPIVWASRLAGTPVPERVPGSDLVLSLPEAAGRGRGARLPPRRKPRRGRGRRPAARGPQPEASAAWRPTARRSDSRTIRRSWTGSGASVREARPLLVLIGLGFPKQERLIRRLRSELPRGLVRGCGISLSFLAGEQPRAPAVVQRLGLEWIHRLCA